jgi:hypothetical protein
MLVMLIGQPKVQLLELKTKEIADHVGLSQQPELSKVSAKSVWEVLNHSLNNN